MKGFVRYDYRCNELKSLNENIIPEICKEYSENDNKKCKRFYASNKCEKVFLRCPYGFYCYFDSDITYSSFILKDDISSQLIENIKKGGQKIKDFSIFNREQLINILNENKKFFSDKQLYEDVIHDLGNITNLLNSSREKVDKNFIEIDGGISCDHCIETKEDIKIVCALSELISYRLKILNESEEKNSLKSQVKLHRIFTKIVYMLTPSAKKKDVIFSVSSQQDNIYDLSRNVYLAIYIILENAVKYSIPEKYIRISFYEDSYCKTIVEIENLCDKIEESEKNYLMKRGYRGKNASPTGSGIGMFKAQQIFNQNGIDIDIDIRQPNNLYSLFTVKLVFRR